MDKPIAIVWTFASSSGRGYYETRLYTDGSTSCNCKGWTRRVDAVTGTRDCKHTKMVEANQADTYCFGRSEVYEVPRSAPCVKIYPMYFGFLPSEVRPVTTRNEVQPRLNPLATPENIARAQVAPAKKSPPPPARPSSNTVPATMRRKLDLDLLDE
jgi:hypothetical protein